MLYFIRVAMVIVSLTATEHWLRYILSKVLSEEPGLHRTESSAQALVSNALEDRVSQWLYRQVLKQC